MKISDNLAMLEIKGGGSTLHPVLIWDDTNVALIDVGFPGQLELFRQAIADCGFTLDRLTHILLTHQDLDHIGCLKEIIAIAPQVKVLAHRAEAPCIRGEAPPSKMLAKAPPNPTEEEKVQMTERIANYQKFTAPVDQELEGDEVIPICGGIEVLHTPGHTIGHVCYYMHRDKVLMTGDTVGVSEGSLTGAVPIHTADMELAHRSNRTLMRVPATTLISYHGGVFRGNISEALDRLTSQ